MKTVVFTQRVEIVESYQERRDCADQRISEFITACGFLPIPISNKKNLVCDIIQELQPVGIILSGGNSLCAYGGNAPERDSVDSALIKVSLREGIPLYGFCRGMQSILYYFGNVLENVQNHVAVRHTVHEGQISYEVNSYHNQACRKLNENCGLSVVAWSEDGVVEAVRHTIYPIVGTMWHPERERDFSKRDILRVKNLFKFAKENMNEA